MEEHLARCQKERVKLGKKTSCEFQQLDTHRQKVQESLIAQINKELDALDKSHDELSEKVSSQRKQTAEATKPAGTPTVSLSDLLAGKIDAFELDVGDLLDLGPEVGTLEEADVAEVSRRKEQLANGITDMANDLFAKAIGSIQTAKTAHAKQAKRLLAKRRR
eukprot:3014537-Pyramimonas_sp.AAC.1